MASPSVASVLPSPSSPIPVSTLKDDLRPPWHFHLIAILNPVKQRSRFRHGESSKKTRFQYFEKRASKMLQKASVYSGVGNRKSGKLNSHKMYTRNATTGIETSKRNSDFVWLRCKRWYWGEWSGEWAFSDSVHGHAETDANWVAVDAGYCPHAASPKDIRNHFPWQFRTPLQRRRGNSFLVHSYKVVILKVLQLLVLLTEHCESNQAKYRTSRVHCHPHHFPNHQMPANSATRIWWNLCWIFCIHESK